MGNLNGNECLRAALSVKVLSPSVICPFEKKTLSAAVSISFAHLLVRWGHSGATAGWGNLLKRSDNGPSAV